MIHLAIAALGAFFALNIASVANGWMASQADLAFLLLTGTGVVAALFGLGLGNAAGPPTNGTSGHLALVFLFLLALAVTTLVGSGIVLFTSAFALTYWSCLGIMGFLTIAYVVARAV